MPCQKKGSPAVRAPATRLLSPGAARVSASNPAGTPRPRKNRALALRRGLCGRDSIPADCLFPVAAPATLPSGHEGPDFLRSAPARPRRRWCSDRIALPARPSVAAARRNGRQKPGFSVPTNVDGRPTGVGARAQRLQRRW